MNTLNYILYKITNMYNKLFGSVEYEEANLENAKRGILVIQERLKTQPKWLKEELKSVLNSIEVVEKSLK